MKYPMYADQSRRTQSFLGKRVGNGQTVERLVAAGFFHVGPEDNVRCFQCDGGLKNWQPADDPWIEHARWFPRCPFLLANKDQTFIRDAQASRNAANHTFVNSSTSRGSSPQQFVVEPREIKARLDSENVKAVIGMGFQRDVIRRVIEHRLRTHGDDFPNTESLMEAIFEFDDQPISHSGATQQSAGVIQSTVSDVAAAGASAAYSQPKSNGNSRAVSGGLDVDDNALSSGELEVLEENRQLKDARTCKVCMAKEVDTVFLPCGHLVCCSSCSPALRNCAICRALIRGTVKIFLS
jgi:hypothetical protein